MKQKKRMTSERSISWFLFLIYSISLLPVFLIGIYNYPSADDYSIGNNARQAWVLSGSVVQTIIAAILRAIEDWKIWMGYFTSNFFMALPPSVFGEKWYGLTTVIVVLSISLSTGYLLSQIFRGVFKADKYISRSVIMILLFFTIHCMVGRVEALYWYCSAANYMLTHSLALFFLGMMISLQMKNHGKFFLVFSIVLGFLVGGANQPTALNILILLFTAFVLILWKKKAKEYRRLLFPALSFVLGFSMNVLAPGNWIRSEISNGMNPIKAILVSLLYGLEYCIGEWTDWTILFMVICLVPFLWKLTIETEYSFENPVIVVFFGFGLVSAMMTPPLFAVGNIGAGRLQAITFTMYLLILLLCEFYVLGWFRKKYWNKREDIREISRNDKGFFINCLLFFALGVVLTVMADPHYYTFSSALTDLGNGNAQRYGQAMEERIRLYTGGEKDVVVEPLGEVPELLFFSDLAEDSEDWINKAMCRYYGLNTIKKREIE